MISRPSSHPTAHRLQRAYAYRCAMCGFDGRLGRNPVAIEGAHVRWHSQDGPDDLANAIALCTAPRALGLRRPRPQPGPADYRIPAVCRDQPGRPGHRRPRRPATTERPARPAVRRRHLTQLAHDPGLQKPRPPGRLSTADPAADAHGPRKGTVTCQASPPRGTSTIPRSVSSKFLPQFGQTNSGGGGRTCTALRWVPSSGHSAKFTHRA